LGKKKGKNFAFWNFLFNKFGIANTHKKIGALTLSVLYLGGGKEKRKKKKGVWVLGLLECQFNY